MSLQRMKIPVSLLIMAVVFSSGSATFGQAGELAPLEGTYQLDAREGELGLILTGSAAAALYEALPGEAEGDSCTGGTKKSDSNGVFCLKSDSGVSCSLGYVPARGAVTAGPLTC